MQDFGSVLGQPMVTKSRLELTVVGNGYFVSFMKGVDRRPVAGQGPLDGPPVEAVSEEERIDAMVDAIGAFIRHINNKGAGEDWQSEGAEDREKIRAGFKAMIPASLLHGHRVYEPPPEPEQLVFKSKAELIKFIEENF
jgi:hypothetical protein